MSAFIPIVPTGSFTSKNEQHCGSRTTTSHTAPKMTAKWPDDTGPSYEKYLSAIPLDRLNKAPFITINDSRNPEYRNVSVRLADFRADEAAGDSLKAGIAVDDDAAPPESAYSAYYDPATIHEAPMISIYGDASESSKKEIYVIQAQTPLRRSEATVLLGNVDPDPALFADRFYGRLNKAPNVQVEYRSSDYDSTIYVETTFQPLPMATAAEILGKYRR